MPESYVARAELLADLGRYDEAAAELAEADPGDVPAHTLLARVRLAAGAPAEALAAADAAVAAGPADLGALIARGMALADLGRVDEAAGQAEQILRHGRGDGYACTSAAAILAEVRNGQVALDAAWEGVRLTPEQPRAHLVLGVVAARLGLDQIAARAYREALTLDPQLPVAQAALGVARAEQQRYAAALSRFRPARPAPAPADPAAGADAAGADPAAGADAAAGADVAAGAAGGAAGPPGGLGRSLRYGAGYGLVAPLLVAWAHASGAPAGLGAVLLAGAGVAAMWLAWRRLPEPVRAGLPEALRADRPLAVAVAAVALVPGLLVLYALSGSAWPLAGAAAAGAVALFAHRPPR